MIRTATSEDIPAIVDIFRTARATAMPWLPVLHSAAGDLKFFERVVREYDVEVAELEGAVAGFISSEGDWLEQLYITPSRQGQGLGSALVARAQDKAISLQLWVFEQNVAAQRFYLKHGFSEVERTDGANNEERCPDIRMMWQRA